MARVVVVGGGLAGLSAACELLERGCKVTILEKTGNLGGNSSKATCGIAAPGCELQKQAGIQDDAADLLGDSPAASALVKSGAQDVEWLTKALGVNSELVIRLTPGHGLKARTIGTKTHFPGAVVTYAAIHVLQQVAAAHPDKLEIVPQAEVKQLIKAGSAVTGVEYLKDGRVTRIQGLVVIATGGYAGDYSQGGVLARAAPNLLKLPTTNDERASGDGLKLGMQVGAGCAKLDKVQVIPTAAVLPGQESAQFKVVISDAICGAGAKLIDANGNRFCDELSSAQVRVEAMSKAKGPFRVVIKAKDAEAVQWLCDFYHQRSIMKRFDSVAALANEMRVDPSTLKTLFGSSALYVAKVTPALYACDGGLTVGLEQANGGKVLTPTGQPIDGLYAAGEATSSPFQKMWSVTGIPLLYAIYSGRMAGRAAAFAALGGKDMPIQDLQTLIISAFTKPANTVEAAAPVADKKPEDMTKDELFDMVKALQAAGPPAAAAAPEGPAGITLAELAKHNTKDDAWIAVNGDVINVVKWISVHPGGEQAVTAYLGQDATEEWNMIHKPGTIEKNLVAEGGNGPWLVGKIGAGGGGGGGAPGVLGAIVFTLLSVIKLTLKTVFFTGNFKFNVDGNRTGTIRSAIFLLTFTIVHALGNFVDMLGGPNELNGEGYLFDRIHWTGALGFAPSFPFSVVEEYLAFALLVHVSVALKRSWDISINYCVYTGRWNMLISGLTILTFLTIHLQDFRFYPDFKMTELRVPPNLIAFDGLLEGRVFYETNPDIKPTLVRDLYSHEVELFSDLGKVLLYTSCVLVFVLHLCMGWKKLVPADAMQIPKDHVRKVTWLGWIAAAAVAGMYMSVPWYVYFMPPAKVAHVA